MVRKPRERRAPDIRGDPNDLKEKLGELVLSAVDEKRFISPHPKENFVGPAIPQEHKMSVSKRAAVR